MNYAGIGSRETPDEILSLIKVIAKNLASKGFVVRTGGAPGADTAFIEGAREWGGFLATEVYLPWKTFQDWDWFEVERTEPQEEAFEIAAKFHPSWKYLKHGGKKLHARNVHQILGPDVTNPTFSEFVICYTKDGKEQGGTAQGLRIAKHYDIPIFNLGKKSVETLFRSAYGYF